MNILLEVFEKFGPSRIARACEVSHEAARKWRKNGRLPRTEWTGETHHAEKIAALQDGIDPDALKRCGYRLPM